MPRASGFTQAIGDAICERLSDGESLRSICDSEDMPNKATVFRWLAADEAFRDQYAAAREAQADAMVDDMLDIADDGRNDWMAKRNDAGEVTAWQENGEALRRSALRIDARKWLAGKMQPKKYGDKVQLDHSGELKLTPSITINGKRG
jgi:hypothetical protein